MGTRRIFVAIVPPEKIINSLLKSIRLYKKESWGKDVRWVKYDNLHLTLKFIGQIEISRLDQIFTAIESSINGLRSFPIELEGLKLFPKPFSPRVISSGIVYNPKLNELVSRIETSLFKLGIQKEKRNFKGHITIGRCKKTFPKRQTIENYVERLSFPVNEVIVYQSTLRPEGVEYSVEKRITLY